MSEGIDIVISCLSLCLESDVHVARHFADRLVVQDAPRGQSTTSSMDGKCPRQHEMEKPHHVMALWHDRSRDRGGKVTGDLA